MLYDKHLITKPNGAQFYDVADTFGPELEMRMWIDAVISDHDPVVLPNEMLVVSKIIDAIYESSFTGTAVDLSLSNQHLPVKSI